MHNLEATKPNGFPPLVPPFLIGNFPSFLLSFQTEQFAVLWILFIVIVLGNLAVLVTLFMNKNRKSRMNFFIKQLAIAGEESYESFKFISNRFKKPRKWL